VSVFATPADLLGNAKDIDIAVVATPNGSHAVHAIATIERGIPTVVDRPFARTVAEAEAVQAAAATHGTLVSAYHNRRWGGDFLTVRSLVADGRLGDRFRFESRIDRWVDNAGGLA
jgi:scyllo-inositol 2-dehydrogenase (NADP+)